MWSQDYDVGMLTMNFLFVGLAFPNLVILLFLTGVIRSDRISRHPRNPVSVSVIFQLTELEGSSNSQVSMPKLLAVLTNSANVRGFPS